MNWRDRTQQLGELEADEGLQSRRPATAARVLQRKLGNQRLLQLRARALQRQVDREWFEREIGVPMADEREIARVEESERAAETMAIPTGSPLAGPIRGHAEEQLGVPMDDVSVVESGGELCDSIDARAFTTHDVGRPTVVLGSDVDLDSADGQFTLMHELSHVAQQKRGEADRLEGIGGDEEQRETLEQDADKHACQMLRT